MRRPSFCCGLFLIILLVPTVYSLTFASDEGILGLQGKIMELDLERKMMVVNERVFFWSSNASFYDEKGSLIPPGRLGVKSWVYIEAKRQDRGGWIAEKIYLIPKYIHGRERHLYPFIR